MKGLIVIQLRASVLGQVFHACTVSKKNSMFLSYKIELKRGLVTCEGFT